MLPACSPSADDSFLAVEIAAKENTLDGCTACGCRARGALDPGTEGRWWVSFGLVRADDQGGWETVTSSSHCGVGSFEEVAPDFGRTVGTPYVVLGLSLTAAVPPAGEVSLDTRWSVQKLSGFGEGGEPVYGRRTEQRLLRFAEEEDLAFPLMVADGPETEAFGVHEVLLQLRVSLLGRGPARAYGSLAVSADVPGGEVLLDGGLVGRVAEGHPTLLENVLAGTREIRVRDFSGREVRREVAVDVGETAEVTLAVLPQNEAAEELVPLGENPQGHAEFWRVRDAAVVVRIPAGEFLMGSPEGEGEAHERPQHRIHLSEFLIDKNEVTWRQFRRFAAATGAQLPRAPIWGTPDDYPVAFVLWQEAQDYCEWAGGRLPSEAEWEKAARGTDGRKYPWGDAWDARRCNSISGGLHRPEPVGSYPGCVSPYGVLDMAGGSWEWCADRYREAYYAESPSHDPAGPTEGRLRVMRGGAWMSQPIWLRTAYRVRRSPTSRNVDHGFRCAQDAPEEPH